MACILADTSLMGKLRCAWGWLQWSQGLTAGPAPHTSSRLPCNFSKCWHATWFQIYIKRPEIFCSDFCLFFFFHSELRTVNCRGKERFGFLSSCFLNYLVKKKKANTFSYLREKKKGENAEQFLKTELQLNCKQPKTIDASRAGLEGPGGCMGLCSTGSTARPRCLRQGSSSVHK